MKTKLTAFFAMFLVTLLATAQIDRSKQPKPGPAPKITLEVPGEFQLKNGLKVLVVENHKLPRVAYSLRIDNKPIFEGDKVGVSSILSEMLGNGTTSISKEAFIDEIDFLGAFMSFGSQSAYASTLSKYATRVLELLADGIINPLLTEEEFIKAKERIIEGLKTQDKDVSAIARRVGAALAYGKNHPRGEFETEKSLNAITLDNVNAFYQKYFNPANAYLVIEGDVDFSTIKGQVKQYFKKWKKGIDVSTNLIAPKNNVQYTQINFIDLPNAVQSNISLTNNVKLKLNDLDYHAVLIANKILGGGFNSYLNMNLREEHAYTYGARSNISPSRYGASRFMTSVAVRNAVTDSAVIETLKEIKRIKTEPVTAEALANAKAKYVGDFVLALENPETVANYALNIKLNNLPKDFYATYLKKINAVTVDDVKRVANTYFKPENARIVVVGKGSEVLSNLEKTGLPIEYFDTFANPVDKPVFSKPIPEGVTAQTVLGDYINAVGGKAKLATIKTVLVSAKATIKGAPFAMTAEVKTMAPNKESFDLTAEGMGKIMSQKWNGKTGYIEQQGKKIPLPQDQIDAKKGTHSIFPELHYDASAIALEAIVSVDGSDAYKIKISNNEKDSYRFYDVKTKYLVKEEATEKDVTSITRYANYSPVNGIQYPYTTTIVSGPQEVSLNVSTVKFNEGVSDADFN